MHPIRLLFIFVAVLSTIADLHGGMRVAGDTGSHVAVDELSVDRERSNGASGNHLNRPTEITWDGNSNKIAFTYDAGGTLLTRIASSGPSINDRRDFIGGIEYSGTFHELESIAHSEGRVYFGEGSERYDFALADHLGNTRILYADLNGDGEISVPTEIIQEEHYMPFGMKMAGPWMGGGTADDTRNQYNGIEHVDDFDLGVDMAFYWTLDPVVGRWWSVDPKAEDYMSWTPYNSMGNSPMVQIDPNGDALPLLAIVGIGAAVFGTGNLAAQAVAGNINSFGDGLEAFGTGAVAGAALTAGAAAGWSVPILGPVIKGALVVKATTTGIGALGGAIQGITTGDWSGLGHAGKIFLGNFYSDSERSPISQMLQLTSRHSWELLQTEIGHSYSQLRNSVGRVDRVDLYRGATFTQRYNTGTGFRRGISLGNFINVAVSSADPGVTLENEPDRRGRPGLLRHEYGHIFDSHRWGPLYLFGVGIPSAAGAEWTENRADNFWRSYFTRHP